MNREKTKHELINEGFTKHNFVDKSDLPSWFLDDEGKHYKANIPITKEAVDALRARQRALDARPIKKIAEAKARAKYKAAQRLAKAQKKADSINETSDISEKEKASNISKLLAKGAKAPKRKETKLVVAKGVNRAQKGRPKGVKGRYKMVSRAFLPSVYRAAITLAASPRPSKTSSAIYRSFYVLLTCLLSPSPPPPRSTPACAKNYALKSAKTKPPAKRQEASPSAGCKTVTKLAFFTPPPWFFLPSQTCILPPSFHSCSSLLAFFPSFFLFVLEASTVLLCRLSNPSFYLCHLLVFSSLIFHPCRVVDPLLHVLFVAHLQWTWCELNREL